jgi:hypothetical protein
MYMSTTINFVTKRKEIFFIAEVRGDGVNTPGYISTNVYLLSKYKIDCYIFAHYREYCIMCIILFSYIKI